MHQGFELPPLPADFEERVAARADAILAQCTLPMRCRCGGAIIETSIAHQGPIHCGEEACELLPRLEPKEGHTPGDLRRDYERSSSRTL